MWFECCELSIPIPPVFYDVTESINTPYTLELYYLLVTVFSGLRSEFDYDFQGFPKRVAFIYVFQRFPGFDINVVNEMCRLASDYVYKLDIRQLKMIQPIQEESEDFVTAPECFDHIDLSPIISGLKNLTELHIQFGIRHIGSNYKKSVFELSNEDCKWVTSVLTIGNEINRNNSKSRLRIGC